MDIGIVFECLSQEKREVVLGKIKNNEFLESLNDIDYLTNIFDIPANILNDILLPDEQKNYLEKQLNTAENINRFFLKLTSLNPLSQERKNQIIEKITNFINQDFLNVWIIFKNLTKEKCSEILELMNEDDFSFTSIDQFSEPFNNRIYKK
ncbi:MAG: hypothetical protein LRY69_02320 [Gammaproteobacteria bacterium]|nr:hypothetical protein [Gammaproteobacteria bacterium]